MEVSQMGKFTQGQKTRVLIHIHKRELSLPRCSTALKTEPKLAVVLVPVRPGLVKKYFAA